MRVRFARLSSFAILAVDCRRPGVRGRLAVLTTLCCRLRARDRMSAGGRAGLRPRLARRVPVRGVGAGVEAARPVDRVGQRRSGGPSRPGDRIAALSRASRSVVSQPGLADSRPVSRPDRRGLRRASWPHAASDRDLCPARLWRAVSLRATNWTHVGMTAGVRVPAKTIWMYPLTRRWRHRPGVAGPSVDLPTPPGRWPPASV